MNTQLQTSHAACLATLALGQSIRKIKYFHFIGLTLLAASLFACKSFAQLPEAPPQLLPDPRYKADILVIVAHPDDYAMFDGYLARASLDEHRRVAVIFCTRGKAAMNVAGSESGAAVGDELSLEARKGLAVLGITNIWFVSGRDTPSQFVLRSLGHWDHARVLGEVIRLVRLTRPEVILTTLPDVVAGENHGDHQAAGVIATEAFDLAGDPTFLSEQVSPPLNPRGFLNYTDGLHPWQSQKIYYFTDAFDNFGADGAVDSKDISPFRKNFVQGTGPSYSTTAVSPSRHVPYAEIDAEEQSNFLTQEGIGDQAKEAIEKGDFHLYQEPVRFIFGKSVVKSSVTGDIFEGVIPGSVPFSRVRGFQFQQSPEGVTLEFGGSWAFYKEFWSAHDIQHLAKLLPIPEVAVDHGGELRVPLLINNETRNPEEVSLTVKLPNGWVEKAGSARYHVGPGDSYPAEAILVAPSEGKEQWQEITWKAEAGGQQIGNVILRVLVGHVW